MDPVDASKMALVLLTNLGGVFWVSFLLIPTGEVKDWDTLAHLGGPQAAETAFGAAASPRPPLALTGAVC